MTFKQFESIVKKHRPDAIVSKHGSYANDNSKYTLGISFIREDGRTSKVYNYAGSYQDVLARLGIETVTKDEIRHLEGMVRMHEEEVKDPEFSGWNVFTNEKERELAREEARRDLQKAKEDLQYYLTSNEVVRIWEVE